MKKRITALIIITAIIFSLFSGLSSLVIADSNITVESSFATYSEYTDAFTGINKEEFPSLVTSKPTVKYYTRDNSTASWSTGTTANLRGNADLAYDGDIGSGETGFSDVKWDNYIEKDGSTIKSVNMYVDFTYNLGKLCEVKHILAWHHLATSAFQKKYTASELDIYYSDDGNNLTKNTAAAITGNDKMRTLVTFTAPVKAQYITLRIYKPGDDTYLNESTIYYRMHEFNVYGKIPESNEIYTLKTNADDIDKSTSVAVGTKATLQFDIGDGKGPKTISDSGIESNVVPKYNDNVFGKDGDCGLLSTKYASWVELKDGADSGTKNLSDVKDAHQDGSRVLYITLPLSYASDIEHIFVAGHSADRFKIGKYEIFASTEESTLYNTKNSVVVYDNFSAKEQYQDFKIKTGKLSGIKYVGMKMYFPSADWESVFTTYGASYVYVRLAEFNVYGKRTPLASVSGKDATIPSGNNFLEEKSANIAMVDKAQNITENITAKNTLLTDGRTDASLEIKGNDVSYVKSGTIKNDGTVYTDIGYALGGEATLEKVFVAHAATKALRTGKIELYVSDNENKLFTDGSFIADYTNTNGDNGTLFTLTSPIKKVRAIGIRIIDPVYNHSELSDINNAIARINEIVAIGTYSKDLPVKVINNDKAEIPAGINLAGLINVTSGSAPSLSYNDTIEEKSGSISYGSNIKKLNDENLEEGSTIGSYFAKWEGNGASGHAVYHNTDNTHYVDVVYNLKTEVDLGCIIIANHASRELVTGKYEVFVGNDKNSLYDAENLYTTVDNVSTYNDGGSNRVNAIKFDSSEPDMTRTAQFVGIRIWNPVCEAGVGSATVYWDSGLNKVINFIYPRLLEFSVYGTYADPNYNPEIYAPATDTMDFDLNTLPQVYGENLIKDEKATFILDGKKFTPANMKTSEGGGYIHYGFNPMMEASNGENHVDIGDHRTGTIMDIQFKINDFEYTKIKGIAYQGMSTNLEMYWTAHYQVFVAEEPEDLYRPETLVYEYDANSAGIQKGQIREFAKGKEPVGCYVAFRILDPCWTATSGDYSRISLLYVWGENYIKVGKPSNLAENMPIEAYFNNDGKLTEVSESNLTVNEVKNLTDADDDTTATINTKGSKRDKLEIFYNLCNEAKVDGFRISALVNSEAGFKTLKVYGANVLGKVNDESSLLWTYKISKTGTINAQKSFGTAKAMRYVRFVFGGTKDSVQLGELYVNGLDNQKLKTRILTNSLSSDDITITSTEIKTGKKNYFLDEPSANMSGGNFTRLIDNDQLSSFTFRTGIIGENKFDIVIDLDDLRTVSGINIKMLRYFDEYRVTKFNVYIGETEAEILDENNPKPTYSITDKDFSDAAEMNKLFRPRLARYVRIELLDFSENDIYLQEDGKYRICAAIADILITGTTVKGMQTSEESEELISFTDKKTGVIATINRLDTNDIFTDVVGIKVTDEKTTNWQMESLRKANLMVAGKKVYKIEFLDLYGNPVTNIGRRNIRISFKTPKGFENGGTVIGDANHRKAIVPLTTSDMGETCYTECVWEESQEHKFAVLVVTTEDDSYWDEIGPLEDFPEDAPEVEFSPMENDEEFYRWIRTTDDRFRMTLVYSEIPEGTKFRATDVTASISENQLYSVLEIADGRNVAIAYNMEMLSENSDFAMVDDYADIYYTLPRFISNNYTDLRVYSVDESGFSTELYSELSSENSQELYFQTTNMGNIVITGFKNENFESDFDYGISPETGETANMLFSSFLALLAAGFVSMKFGKRQNEDLDT